MCGRPPMTKKLFAPLPLRAMAMDLSGLQLRVLICVAAHDRLSLVTGKGQGCRASNERMQSMIGCDRSRLSAALTNLCKRGLLEREWQGRSTRYRVIYTDEDSLLFSNISRSARRVAQPQKQVADRQTQCVADQKIQASDNKREYPTNRFSETARKHSVGNGEENSSKMRDFHRATSKKISFASNVGGQLAALERRLKGGELLDQTTLDRLEEISDRDGQNAPRASRIIETYDWAEDVELPPWNVE